MAQPEDELLSKIILHFKLATQVQVDAAVKAQDAEQPWSNLGEILLDQGVLSPEQHTWLGNARKPMEGQGGGSLAMAGPNGKATPPATTGAAAPSPSAPTPVAAKPAAAAPARTLGSDTALSGVKVSPASPLGELLKKAVALEASDVHVHALAPVQVRLAGQLTELRTGLLPPEETRHMLLDALPPDLRAQLEENLDLDISLVMPGCRPLPRQLLQAAARLRRRVPPHPRRAADPGGPGAAAGLEEARRLPPGPGAGHRPGRLRQVVDPGRAGAT